MLVEDSEQLGDGAEGWIDETRELVARDLPRSLRRVECYARPCSAGVWRDIRRQTRRLELGGALGVSGANRPPIGWHYKHETISRSQFQKCQGVRSGARLFGFVGAVLHVSFAAVHFIGSNEYAA